jgi:hypothetical protein
MKDRNSDLDIHALLAERKQIALIWSVEDLQAVRPDLDDEQAWAVLQEVEHRHDASIGVTWDTLEYAADELFNSSPKTPSA